MRKDFLSDRLRKAVAQSAGSLYDPADAPAAQKKSSLPGRRFAD